MTSTNKLAKPPAPEDEEYRAAVEAGKRIVQQMAADKETAENHKWQLGELADGVVKKYKEGKLERFAKDIGKSADVLRRCRSVFRAWRGEDAPKEATSPKFYSVAQELQSHPRRFEIIKNNPDITVCKARQLTRKSKKDKDAACDYWSEEQTERWFKDVVKHAYLNLEDAQFITGEVAPELQEIIRKVIGGSRANVSASLLLPTLRQAGEALIKLADFLEALLDADDDDSDAEEPPVRPRPTTSQRTAAAAA
jgi:hypothetical protein